MLELLLPWTFVALAIGVVVVTVSAYRPIRSRKYLVLPSFLLGTITAELAPFVAATMVILAGGLYALHAQRSWIGLVALLVVAASALAMSLQIVGARSAARVMRRALEPLGERARWKWRPWRLLVPFPIRLRATRITRNVEFARVAGQHLRLDVYRPRAAEGLRPAVVHVHGGGWVLGDKREQGVPLMAVLSDRGFVGFNVNYRLSPGATWPDHLVDIKRAIAWIREHAADYGVDPSFVAIAGGSAGGHIAAMMGLTAGDATLQPGFESADTRVQAVVPLYALYDLSHRGHVPGFHDTLLEPRVIKAFLDEDPARFERASPLSRIVAGAPPFLVVHGDRDSLAPVQDARRFVEKLREVSDAAVLYAELPGAHHSFDLFVSLRSLPVLEGVADFLEVQWQQQCRSASAHADGGSAAAPEVRPRA